MKKYTTPEIEVVFIDNTEIIVSSITVDASQTTHNALGRNRYDDDDDDDF